MANNSSDELNMQGVLGSPRQISGDKSTIAPAAPPTERAACLQFGGVHAQRPEGNIHRSLPVSTMSNPWVSATSWTARVAVLWRPALDRPPLEGICQYWRIAIVETAQFFHILHYEHGFARLTLFRHSSPLSR